MNALVFLYREFLDQSLEGLDFIHSRRCRRVAAVFRHEEALAPSEIATEVAPTG
ncbi:site-specific recombinase IntIA [Alcanivorax marinus]|nr:site-specific recombinase IntIA [Alloalcanivorax marinus]